MLAVAVVQLLLWESQAELRPHSGTVHMAVPVREQNPANERNGGGGEGERESKRTVVVCDSSGGCGSSGSAATADATPHASGPRSIARPMVKVRSLEVVEGTISQFSADGWLGLVG
jgi:hypothetical protein